MDQQPASEDKQKSLSAQRCHSLNDTKRAASVTRDHALDDTRPAPCLGLGTPRTCATLPPNLTQDPSQASGEPKRKRLWGLRGLVKMFRRRARRKGGVDTAESQHPPPPTLRTRSASELAVDQANRSSGGPYNQGLSVSHDSVFCPESPSEETISAQPGLPLVTRGVNMGELKAALRRRRADDSASVDDDPGLPSSPPTSPTTLDVLNHGLKSTFRTTRSTCSNGSLLSMGSSEYDEDSFGASSHHSSKASLIERSQVVDHEPAAGSVPLSHKAARHKMAVRPRRTHAVPRTRRPPQVLASNLPTTPEVNEESVSKVVTIEKTRTHSVIKTAFSAECMASKSEMSGGNTPFEDKLEDHFSKIIAGVGRNSRLTRPDTTQTDESVVCFRRHAEEYTRKTTDLRKSSPEIIKTSLSSDFAHKRTSPVQSRQSSGSSRCSSVEGRLEGNGRDLTQLSVPSGPHKPPIAPPSPTRYDSQSEQHFISHSYATFSSSRSSGIETASSKAARSSIDNLTTTQLPGVYIRPFSPESHRYPFDHDDSRRNSELDSGPLSLDSSIMSIKSEEEPVKKAFSLDKVTAKDRRESEPVIKPTRTDTVGRSQSINSPSSYVKRMRQSSSEDSDLDSLKSHKKVNREPSFTKLETKKVPEFMRIQLNRVQNKTDPEDTSRTPSTGSRSSLNDPETPTEDPVQDPKKDSDEIVLRRPSVIDRSVLIDQTVSAKRSGKSRNEPELMKVFARRSFKLKDSEDEECDSPSSSSPETNKREVLPTLRSISSKRYSLGSCPLPLSTRVNESLPVTPPTCVRKPRDNLQRKISESTEASVSSGSDSNSPNSTISTSYSRRSFSHFASKVPPSKGLSRTSSANQSDPAFTSAIIKQATHKSQIPRSPEPASKPANTQVQWPPRMTQDTETHQTVPEDEPKSPKDSVKLRPKSPMETVKLRPKTGLVRCATSDSKSLAEARNTSFGQNFLGGQLGPVVISSKTSPVKVKQNPDQPAADWKVLIRKRREDRMKHTKSTDADDILIESRPSSSRNSKVLEMANNFQKLQVA